MRGVSGDRQPDRSAGRSAESGRILIVEEVEQSLALMVRILTTAGYECQTANSVQEALTFLNSGEGFDLILCGMPTSEQRTYSIKNPVSRANASTNGADCLSFRSDN